MFLRALCSIYLFLHKTLVDISKMAARARAHAHKNRVRHRWCLDGRAGDIVIINLDVGHRSISVSLRARARGRGDSIVIISSSSSHLCFKTLKRARGGARGNAAAGKSARDDTPRGKEKEEKLRWREKGMRA